MKNHINEFGDIDDNGLEESLQEAESLCRSLIGRKLICPDGRCFYLRILEIYYGSAGDKEHDWHRNKLYSRLNKEHRANVQSEAGMRFYLLHDNIDSSRRNRVDLVVGNHGVALSFLIRGLWDEEFNEIGKGVYGQPNICLKELKLNKSDHNRELLKKKSEKKEFSLVDTLDDDEKRKFSIRAKCRYNIDSDIEQEYNLKWMIYGKKDF